MIVNLETTQYTGKAAFVNYGDTAVLCYKKQAKTLPYGQMFEIDGVTWRVAGTKTSSYVDGLVNVRLERVE